MFSPFQMNCVAAGVAARAGLRMCGALSGLLLLALPGGAALAQGAAGLSPDDRSSLERLALAKARADLARQTYQLPIEGRMTVGAWAARGLGRDRALRMWIRSRPPYGSARFYSDGTCDVDIRLDPEVLGRQLERLRHEHSAAEHRPLSAPQLRRAAGKWPVLWGSGTAALAERSRSRKPQGWDDVTHEGIARALRAAQADARSALLEKAAELPVTNARRLGEFLDSSAAVRQAVLEALERVATVKSCFEPDQVAVAEASVGMLDLIRVLTDVHQRHYRGGLFHAADFREMALLARQQRVSATGLADPPPRTILRGRYQSIELDTPAWVSTTLAAVGRYEPGDEDDLPPQARVAAARLDGLDRLRQQVEGLVIQKGVTVEAFLGRHDELKDDVIICLSGARIAGPPRELAGDVIEVPVELPLRRLWWIVRRGMRRIEVDLPQATTTQPAEKDEP